MDNEDKTENAKKFTKRALIITWIDYPPLISKIISKLDEDG
jgi:hypothetical protein